MHKSFHVFGAFFAIFVVHTGTNAQSQPTWSAALEAESGSSLPLGWVTGLTVDSQRRVYLTDGTLDGVAVLAPDLTLEREVGRKGEGPGEFEWPATIQILADDSLYVFDGRLFRVTVFEPQALTVAYTITVDPAGYPWGLWMIPGRGGYVGARSLPFSVEQTQADHGRFDAVFVLGADGKMESDSILAIPAAQPLIVRSAGSVMVGAHPFGAESFLTLLGDDRLVYANSRVPTVTLLDLAGTVQESFDVPAPAVPVSTAELRAAVEREEQEAFVRTLEEGAPYTWPALTGLVVDDEMRIWVGARSESRRDEWVWSAYTRAGNRVGSVVLPAGFKLHAVRDGRLFGVATDELDVPQVQVYRLR